MPGRPPFDPAAAWRAWWESVGVRSPLSGDVVQRIDTALFRVLADELRLGPADAAPAPARAAPAPARPADPVDHLVAEVRALRADGAITTDALRRLRDALG
jgi:hypothetical protein